MNPTFDKHAPQMIADLIADFQFTDFQAAAFPGQTAAESAWMKDIIEDAAIARGWAGGTGWFQWTGMREGDRREEFEDWLARKKWKADSYEANYSYLFRELKGYSGTESKIVARVKGAASLEQATEIVCREFLRPADPAASMDLRIRGAKRALELYRANPPKPTVWPTDKPKEAPVNIPINIPSQAGGILGGAMGGPAGAMVGALLQAILMASTKHDIPVTPAQAPAVTSEIVQELQKLPGFQHLASTEGWYQSRANWSAIISGAVVVMGPLAALAGWKLDWLTPEVATSLSIVFSTVGGLVASFLARRARTATKPLFFKEPDQMALVLQQLNAITQNNAALQTQLAELRAGAKNGG